MERISECKDCKTWEEDMYWTHFSSLHFFVTLPPNSHDHLVLPKKFASHVKFVLPNKVSLKAPSGVLWKVNVQKSDDILFVGDDWKGFVKANNLTENDLLLFKYDRNSTFEVLIFDQESSCERESSYFLKKCGHFKSDHDDQNTEIAKEVLDTTMVIKGVNEDFDFHESNKHKKDNGKEGCSGLKANTQNPLKNVLQAATKCRDGPRSLIQQHESPIGAKAQTRKRPLGNETGKKRRQMSQEDVPRKARSKKSSNKNDVAGGLSHNTIELITSKGPNNSENFHLSKDQSENAPARDETANGPSPISERDLIDIKMEENFETKDHSYKLNDQFEKIPSMNDKLKELSEALEKELRGVKAHDVGENSPVTDCFQGLNDQIDPSASDTIELATPISWRTPDGRECSQTEGHSGGKSSGQKKKGLHDSMKKSEAKKYKCVLDKKYFGDRTSNRRPVTKEEKADAIQRASQKGAENSFTAIMRPTSVYRRFFLNIPSKWPFKNLLQLNQNVVLRVGEKTWVTTFTAYGSECRGLYNGWKKFAVDNDLEEFDVLVFTPVSPIVVASIVLDVDIFRVVSTSNVCYF